MISIFFLPSILLLLGNWQFPLLVPERLLITHGINHKDEYFHSMPRVRSLRGRQVSKEVYTTMIEKDENS